MLCPYSYNNTMMMVANSTVTCKWLVIYVKLNQYLPVCMRFFRYTTVNIPLTLNLLTWRIWWAPNNASKWQMGFNPAFKGL